LTVFTVKYPGKI